MASGPQSVTRLASYLVRTVTIPESTVIDGYGHVMRTSCVRPGCGGSAAAAVLIDRDQQLVVLHPPEVGGPGAIALCARHVARVTTPAGWQLDDLRVVIVLDEPVDAAPPLVASVPDPVPVSAGASVESSLVVDDGATPLLRRAFRAASPGELRRPGQPRGFAWLERRHGQVDGGPGGLRERVEQHGQQPRDREPGDKQRHNGDVGRGDDEPHHERDQQRAERDDRVHPHRPDEVTFRPLEEEPATRATLDHVGPAPEQAA
jgi:hypothetical protein